MGDFKGVSEKFRMSLAHHDGQSDRVVVQIGLDGLKILNANTNQTTRNYELSHISRWQSRGNSLVLYTKTPVDVEERQTTLTADDHTVRSALDTLTCCCMQLAELLQSKQNDTAQETANNLHALVAGGGKKKTPLPSADEVEYWKTPDKAGYMQCQGEHLKSWRSRWFVLKQGYLYRFMNDKVNESIKPRGVVDLSKIQDIKVLPGRTNTIQLKTTSGGTVCYIAATETEVVEWVSALESAVQKICKHAAGMEDEPAKPKQPSASNQANEWIKQLERNFQSNQSSTAAASSSGRSHTNNASSSTGNANLGSTLVNIVGYDVLDGRGNGGAGSSGTYRQESSSHRDSFRDNSPYANLSKQYSGGYTPISSANVAGANVVSDLDLNYGGAAGGFGDGRSASGSISMQQHHAQHAGGGGAYGAPSPHQQHAPMYGNGSAYGQAPQLSQPQQGYYGQAPPQQQQQPGGYGIAQPQPGVSLMDQMPHAQPAYPYFQHQPSAQQLQLQQAPPPAVNPWQVHYSAEGRPYYYNPATGITQWEAPAGMA